MKTKNLIFSLGLTALALSLNPAFANQISTNMAQMHAMDKITGRVSIIDVPVGGEVKFGTFSVVVRKCNTNAEGEVPENYAFIDVTDKSFDKEEFNIFKGWMLSSSPAVNAIEHPIYDVWLLKCYNNENKITGLLSEEELAKRDKLPRLQEIKQQIKDEKTNTFENNEKINITFKDSMYKETPAPKSENVDLYPNDEQKPQNLLNISENFDEPEEEIISIPSEELSDALKSESENLKSEESILDDELTAAINAELKKHKD